MVLLEILSGSGTVRQHSDGAMGNLAQWAEPFLSNKVELHRVTDKKHRSNVPMKEACELAEIILSCLSCSRKQRPTMAEVVPNL